MLHCMMKLSANRFWPAWRSCVAVGQNFLKGNGILDAAQIVIRYVFVDEHNLDLTG